MSPLERVEKFAKALRDERVPPLECPTCGNGNLYGNGIVVSSCALGDRPAHWCGLCGTMWTAGVVNRPKSASQMKSEGK